MFQRLISSINPENGEILFGNYGNLGINGIYSDNNHDLILESDHNIVLNTLFANLGDGEATDLGVNLLSNGFKFRTTDGEINGGGTNYIYSAFAEFPLVSSNDVPGVAR